MPFAHSAAVALVLLACVPDPRMRRIPNRLAVIGAVAVRSTTRSLEACLRRS